MSLTESIFVAAVIAIAAGYLARRAWRHFAGNRGGCGCAGCPAKIRLAGKAARVSIVRP